MTCSCSCSICQNGLFFFVLMTYIFFLVLFLITGLVTTFATDSKIVLTVLKTICAWSSFFVLMIFFNRFYKDKTRLEFFKELFRDHFNIIKSLLLILLMMVIFMLSIVSVFLVQKKEFSSLFESSISAYFITFFTNLISGPIGEEPGWRGYFLTEYSKKKELLKLLCLMAFYGAVGIYLFG